ncbi:MAG: hypothetical protein E6G95_19855 [Alphaproteobacteria bacterium]|jgi:hypothetical protein|nr:MAG: hypothetical protein E6G95_19855 [Alphaproteobacteria bacterium]
MPKLSGALLAIVVAAALVVAVAIAGSALAFDQLRAIGSRYMVAVAFIAAWSLLFLVMTMMRARATPVVASAGPLLWVAYRFCVAAASGGWPLVVDLLAEAVLAAGFCGYMLGGEQPKAYYRGRLPGA